MPFADSHAEKQQLPPPTGSSSRPEASDSSSSGPSATSHGYSSSRRPSSVGSVEGIAQYDGHRPSEEELTRCRSRRLSASQVSAHSTGFEGVGLVPWFSGESIISRIRSRPPVPPFHHPLAGCPTTDDYLVDFDGPDDPYRPVNWPPRKKATTTLLYGLVTMTATWASSAYSSGTHLVAAEFDVSHEVAVLGTTLFLLGFGLGPLLWAPLSEVYGRRVAVLTPMAIAVCFSFATATAKDLQTILLTRFFGAVFSSAPVTNTGGVLGDLYTPAHRGYAMAGYALAVVGGPTLGPIASSAVAQDPSLGWRWTEYITGILQAFVLAVTVLLVDETYPPSLLVRKARQLRITTGNWALHARFEEWDVTPAELARKFLIRPLQLLATPICALIALYTSFTYGVMYMQLGAVPIIFAQRRGWGLGVRGSLPFLAQFLGAVTGLGINAVNQVGYNRALKARGERVLPERRLPPMMLGSVLLAGGQFMMGWTAEPEAAPWIVPVIGLYLSGCGFNTVFQAGLNYLVDTFHLYAASAVAANTFLRSCFAAAFPLAVGPLYNNLGVGPGASIFGGFACLLIPVPFVFYAYGKRIRAASHWSKGSCLG
ncbi:MFS general substrate transporter [Sodiomyces alkalinus F11]|uniref:MFS general substrate transporter n=1 Tax=Sodiomyces alkalinus (strain CBS 110278 / VKM F-3762 / F11) TaxID=1314773 RepID=A0A3N2PKU3_SODAK|nr:MFS general substrate transporter [Sodiomyces alkalinus F11]ROT35030.1 MFS general substrate transporter [Sodiomyces alkalinus F11]